MRIIADTATLITPQQGAEMGISIVPICVIINNQSYKDYVEIGSEEFLRLIQAGGVPSSSQPSLGDVMEIFEQSDEDAVFLAVGDGLSGAYQTAVAAKNNLENGDHIHVVNTKTLAGPMRYLAKKAVEMKNAGYGADRILSELHASIESSLSFVIPADFEFLKRSGRLTTIAAKVGGALKLIPVMTQTEDKTRIRPLAIKRSWKSAVKAIFQQMQSAGVDARHLISICHADTPDLAEEVGRKAAEVFPETEVEILQLSPALITHGGPGCIVVQSVLK